MVPPYAMAQVLIMLDIYYYFRDATVLDLFSGACGWLMSFMFIPSHYIPRRWVAVDIDSRRLQICKLVSKEVGVDVVTVRRDLTTPYVQRGDVVVGSPPCHEFTRAKTTVQRRIEDGLALVRSYLRSVKMINPNLAVMEEAATTGEAPKLLTELLSQHGFMYGFFDLRDFGAIQNRRRRLIAWKISK
jgi:site-specific DNA-cytosine methylase